MRRELSDAQWQLIAPHLPPKKRMGRPRADDRKTLEGILWVLRSGARWRDVPREYTPGTTCWRRLKEWEESGVWETLWRVILSSLEAEQKLDWAQAFLDGSFVPAKKGGAGVGLTRRGKGSKLMLVTEGAGLPVGLHLDSAQQAEVKLAQTTLETVRVQPPRGRPRTRPEHLLADKGYDSGRFRHYLRRRGIGHTIPPIRRKGRRRPGRPIHADPIRYASRWIIERTTAWLQNFRRVLVRHERLLTTYRAFVVLACVMITLGALLR